MSGLDWWLWTGVSFTAQLIARRNSNFYCRFGFTMSSTAEEVTSTPSFKRAKNHEAATTATDEHEHEHPADVAAAAAAASAADAPEGSDPAAHASHPYYQYSQHYPYPYDYAAYDGHEHHPTTYAAPHHTAVHDLHGAEAEHESSAVVSPPDQEITSSPIRSTAASGEGGGDLSYGYDQPYSHYYPPPNLMHVAPSPVNTAASSLALMASQSSPENSRKRKASYDQHQSQQYDTRTGYYGQGPFAGAPPDGAGAYAEADEGEGERIIFRLYREEDKKALSERHCYVRQCYIQAFTATASDVSSRHSKGAQKLMSQGQVGVRCIFCSHLPQGDRAERAVCYPRSISRLYQTVADMQRFHFENCRCIPIKTKNMYQALKTSRKRGQEKPQDYWIRSAQELGLYDNPDGGIFYDATRAIAVPYADEGSEDRIAAEADAADAEAEAAAAVDAAVQAAAREDGDDAIQNEDEKGTADGGVPV